MRAGIRWDPLNPYRHRNLGIFALTHLHGRERSEVVVEGFRSALAIEPRLLDEIADQLEYPRGSYDLLIACMPRRSDAWLLLAERFEREGRREVSAGAFEEALSLASDPASQASVRVAYARSLLAGGKPRSALDHARQAVVAAPGDHRVFGILGEVYEALGQFDRAAEALTTALTLATREGGTAATERWRLVSFYQRQGRLQEALSLQREAAEGTPNNPFHRLVLGQLLEQTGAWDQAVVQFEAVLRLATDNRGLRLTVAETYARHGLLREAAAAYEASIPPGLDREHASVRMRLAEVYRRLGRPDQAAEQYREVLRFTPNQPDARAALAALTGSPASVASP
jgi:tetratricopeptide (TPR) repeat protein